MSGSFANSTPSCDQLPGWQLAPYVEFTASSSLREVVVTNLKIGPWRPPQMLIGIPMPGFSWAKAGEQFPGIRHSIGEGPSFLGAMSIETHIETKGQDFLKITIIGLIESAHLTEAHIHNLKTIFPSLKVDTQNIDGPEGRKKIQATLSLNQADLPDHHSFKLVSRSLIKTLLNDPVGVLGRPQIQSIPGYTLPKPLSKLDLVSRNMDFFGYFGEFVAVSNGLWRARHRRYDLDLLDSQMTIDHNGKMTFSLQHHHSVGELKANIRRVVSALLFMSFDQVQNHNLWPSAETDGISWLTFHGFSPDLTAIEVIKWLNQSQGQPGFQVPIENLNPRQVEFAKQWMLKKLRQDDLSGTGVELKHIIKLD